MCCSTIGMRLIPIVITGEWRTNVPRRSIPHVVDTEPVPAEAADEGVADFGVKTDDPPKRSAPNVGQCVKNTLDADIEDVVPKDVGQEKKSKKRKHKKAAKRARKAAEKVVDDDVPKETKEVIPPVAQPSVDDEWLPEHEQQGGDAREDVQDSYIEDVAVVMSSRRKEKGNLMMNESRTRVGKRRISKNVDVISTANVSLNSEEEEARCRFVANRRISAEWMLFEATKKNPNIMNILEGAGVMPTVAIVGPYYLKQVREFICNMTEDIDDHTSLARKSVFEVRLRSLSGEADPNDDLVIDGSGAEAPET
ncbi:hypothetical protein LIER_30460 [Lithospermum erythrorhizon]|uniref:Uncharacterized protein n=1 Tax=Lithospermum erythrorhizon TaxID=34254 RepID=A0AAV3RPZ0_LITER